MASDLKGRDDAESNFSFGVRELRRAASTPKLTVQSAPPKAATENLGSDPYNTSGSFDRKKNWIRVGKR